MQGVRTQYKSVTFYIVLAKMKNCFPPSFFFPSKNDSDFFPTFFSQNLLIWYWWVKSNYSSSCLYTVNRTYLASYEVPEASRTFNKKPFFAVQFSEIPLPVCRPSPQCSNVQDIFPGSLPTILASFEEMVKSCLLLSIMSCIAASFHSSSVFFNIWLA